MSFAATLAAFPQGADAFRRALDAAGIQGRPRFQLELIFEEVVTNAIRYGYRDRPPGTISVSLHRDGDRVHVVFLDDGAPFDPLTHAPPTPPRSIEEACPGRLGLVLVRRTAAHASYERTARGLNKLSLVVIDAGTSD